MTAKRNHSVSPAASSILGMSFSIALYGAYQYVKREKEHRMLLQRIAEEDVPGRHAAVDRIKPVSWRLLTLILEALFIVFIVWVVYARSKDFNAGDVASLIVLVYLILALPGAFNVFNPALWRLLTLAFIEVLLAGSAVWLVHAGSKILYAGVVAYVIAICFVALFVFLLPVLSRDIRAYRNR